MRPMDGRKTGYGLLAMEVGDAATLLSLASRASAESVIGWDADGGSRILIVQSGDRRGN